jgi:hypothetical protein
MFLHQQSK